MELVDSHINVRSVVAEIMSEHPAMGACGGYTEAVCEIVPRFWFESYKRRCKEMWVRELDKK